MRKKSIFLSVVIVAWFSALAFATTNFKPLPVEEAFDFSVAFVEPNVLMLRWQIAPGYMLYANKIHVNFSPAVKANYQVPVGQLKHDPDIGSVEVLKGNLNLPVTLQAMAGQTSPEQLTMTVQYQGCAIQGFCYPPMHKSVMLNLNTLSATVISNIDNMSSMYYTLKSLLTDQNGVRDLLQALPVGLLLAFFVGLGLLLAFTPCVLPMIPILTSIIIGQEHVPGTKKAFFFSLTYVLGMAVTYGVAGFAAASLGSSIQVWLQKPMTIAFASGVLLLLALSLFGLYELRFSRRWQNAVAAWSNAHESGTFIGVFIMGVLSTLVVSPCVTAPLVGVLIYVSQTGNLLLGALALFAMGLGMGIPLLLIGTSTGKWVPKSGAWMKAVKELFGIFMAGMAIWLLSRIIPLTVTMILFGILFFIAAFFVGVYLPKFINMHKVDRVLAPTLVIIGLFLVFNGVSGMMTQAVIDNNSQKSFVLVTDLTEINHQLAMAQENKRPVMLDFYAGWCESCLTMDRKVFNAGSVRDALNNFVLLRVDLTNNTEEDAAILKHFSVIAPPTILFFSPDGEESNTQRLVGELDANEFLLRLQQFKHLNCNHSKVQC